MGRKKLYPDECLAFEVLEELDGGGPACGDVLEGRPSITGVWVALLWRGTYYGFPAHAIRPLTPAAQALADALPIDVRWGRE